MASVYARDVPRLMETVRNLLDLIEIYKQNGSGWVFSNFSFLQLSLWHLDPIRAGSFFPLPKWIRDKRACVNVPRYWRFLMGYISRVTPSHQ